jgi:hypothetical protein
MRKRDIQCVQLAEFFRDCERADLRMAWVYGNIGSILNDLGITVYASVQDIHEKVDIHRLREELVHVAEEERKWRVAYLGSSLLEHKIADSTEICRFILGELDGYDNVDNFSVIYDYQFSPSTVRHPYVIPSELLLQITSCEWKAQTFACDLTGSKASIFAKENEWTRLHKSTKLHVELVDFQIEVSLLDKLLKGVRGCIDEIAVRADVQPTAAKECAAPEKSKKILSQGVKHDWIGFHSHFFAQERSRLLYGDGRSHIKDPSGERAQASIIKIMEEWFSESGNTPAKNQMQRYAKDILAAIQLNSVKSKKSK